jgi:hypothetical protein
MALWLLYLIVLRVFGWIALLARSQASDRVFGTDTQQRLPRGQDPDLAHPGAARRPIDPHPHRRRTAPARDRNQGGPPMNGISVQALPLHALLVTAPTQLREEFAGRSVFGTP